MDQTDLMPSRLSKADGDALARSIKWAVWYQQREGHLRIVPALLPDQGTQEWIGLGQRCASLAQTMTMKLQPWQAAPADVHDDGEVCDCYARRPEEVAYLRRLAATGLSRFEPDPDTALARVGCEQA